MKALATIFLNSCVLTQLLTSSHATAQTQIADPNFEATVKTPAYQQAGPTVVIDEAHSNFHTAGNRYKPFADLLKSDGYMVEVGTKNFSRESLVDIKILIIANAGAPQAANAAGPAFSDAECDAVRDWVRDGGSLLLIADHAPFGLAAQNLGERFGVEMGKGWVFDRSAAEKFTTQLVFTRENGLLGTHPIIEGRDKSEEVKHIRSFTGQSLSIPNGATALMKLSSTAREAATPSNLNAAARAAQADDDEPLEDSTKDHSEAVDGRAQGIAMAFGKGRVVVVGEAAMFSAQVIRLNNGGEQREIKAGMNVPGTDDRQFALNVLHWLSRLSN